MANTNEFHADIAFHPGETLAEKLEELSMGPKEFALRAGKPEKTILAILRGDSSITPEMAVIFESVLSIPARFWIKKQYSFDEYKAREKRALSIRNAMDWAGRFPYADMVRHGWVAARAKPEEKVAELLNFFGVSSPEAWENYFFNQQLKVAFRISLAGTKAPHALSAWIRQGEIQARAIECGPYSEPEFRKALDDIKIIMAQQPEDFFQKLQKACLACGLKVVHTACVKNAPLSGASRWIRDNPLIQLTGRYKQNDRFWFTFFHEAGHILRHGKKDIFLENVEYSEADLQKEKEADDFAEEWTFSRAQEHEVLKEKPLALERVREFAIKFNTHPAMIIGRLHKKGILPYSVGNEFLVKIDLSGE